MLRHIIRHFEKPLLLDADALNIIAENNELISEIPAGTVLTPHPGEFDRLFGAHQTREERIGTARKMAAELKLIIVLKGHPTTIVTAEKVFSNSTGNAGLAKGGSGDGLTGVITSFLAQGYAPEPAAKIAVFFHGLAADLTLDQQSMESMMISDVISNFGKTFKQIRD